MAAIVKNVKYTGSGTASPAIDTERKLVCGFLPGSGWNGTTITFKWSSDGAAWKDVKETDGSTVSYTVAADDVTRVDPSGWAFASSGYIQVISGSTEDTSSEIKVLLRAG
tara:strand:- start:153 stop:482 length:330 start_codon:yes stop_codon:yes gene_type:complete